MAIPYAPSERYQPVNRLSDFIQRAAAIQAEGQRRGGQIWGNAIQNVGQIAGGAVQDYAADREKTKVAEAISKRDAAFFNYIEQTGGKPDLPGVAKFYGPKDAPVILQSYLSLQEAQAKPGREAIEKLALIAPGYLRMSPGAQKFLYETQLKPLGLASGAKDLPETWSPEVSQTIADFATAFTQAKEKNLMEVSPGASVYDPNTNKSMFTAPTAPKEPPVPVGFSLSPGEVRYGPDGQVIASAPSKPEKPSQARTWVTRTGPDGKTKKVFVLESEVKPDDQPASTREQGRPVTSGDAGRIAELDTSIDDLKALRQSIGETGAASKIGAMLPNVVTELTGWGSDAKQRQGLIDRVKQVIGKALEGGVLRKEDEEKYKKILPMIGDPPEVAKSKLDGLEKAIKQRRERELDAREDAGYDVTKFRERTEGPKIGEERMFNGKVGVWDGKGWAPK